MDHNAYSKLRRSASMEKNSDLFSGTKKFDGLENLPRPTRIGMAMTTTPTKREASNGDHTTTTKFDITPNTTERIINLEKSQSQQLNEMRKDVASKRHEANILKNKFMEITTLGQELELNQELLHAKFYNSAKMATGKEAELDSLESQLENEFETLLKSLQLHKKELELDHRSRLQKLTKTFEDRVDQTLRSKVNSINAQKKELQQDIKLQEIKLQNLDKTTRDRRKQVLDKYDIKLKEISNIISDAKVALADEKHMLESQISKLESISTEKKHRLDSLQDENSRLATQQAQLKESKQNIGQDNVALAENLKLMRSKLASLEQEITGTETQTHSLKRDYDQITSSLEVEERKRRHLNNLLQDLKGNIRVFCRVRPPPPTQSTIPGQLALMEFPRNIGETNNEQLIINDPKVGSKKHVFKFDKVFDMDATNSNIFDEISPLVQSCTQGYNICLFAYGQTGSGKTYTMSQPEIGMIPRTVHQIFEDIVKLSNLQKSPWTYQLTGKFLEIYNENLIDLISETYNSSRKHEIRHDSTRCRTFVTGLTEVELENSEQVDLLLQKANRNRSTASTKANEHSSRSHSIFILTVRGVNKSTGESTEGILNLVDLAGSERLSSSQASGDRLKETQAINKSLSALGDVIAALKNKSSEKNSGHVPFRNSKLTYLLQYSLTGNSKTLMFVNVSPMACHFNETVNSLRFAMKVNNTKIN